MTANASGALRACPCLERLGRLLTDCAHACADDDANAQNAPHVTPVDTDLSARNMKEDFDNASPSLRML
jgi:hypothetical protein